MKKPFFTFIYNHSSNMNYFIYTVLDIIGNGLLHCIYTQSLEQSYSQTSMFTLGQSSSPHVSGCFVERGVTNMIERQCSVI